MKKSRKVSRKVKISKRPAPAPTRKSGPDFVGNARVPFGSEKGTKLIRGLPIREGSGMYAVASLMSRGATMEALEKANRKSKSTVGQHIQHIRYRGYAVTQKGNKLFISPKLVTA